MTSCFVVRREAEDDLAAAALTVFISRPRSGTFLQFSVSPLAYSELCELGLACTVDRIHYGPGLVIGYRHVAASGLTLTVGGGAGWFVEEGFPLPMVQLDVGRTLRWLRQ